MELLTYEEYKEISLLPIEEKVFIKMNKMAEEVINVNTRNFYLRENFNKDYEWRKEVVKRAIAYQIDFFDETGVFTLEEMQDVPQSFSAGRTSVTNANSQSQVSVRQSLLSADAKSILTGTGLLYRGVDSL